MDSSFDALSEEELEAHLATSRYGDFHLSEAIRPAADLRIVPTQGYRHDRYVDREYGCTGIAVLNPNIPLEVQFDEHKLLIGYTNDTRPFAQILEANGVPYNGDLTFLTQDGHVHSSSRHFWDRFQKLRTALAMDDYH